MESLGTQGLCLVIICKCITITSSICHKIWFTELFCVCPLFLYLIIPYHCRVFLIPYVTRLSVTSALDIRGQRVLVSEYEGFISKKLPHFWVDGWQKIRIFFLVHREVLWTSNVTTSNGTYIIISIGNRAIHSRYVMTLFCKVNIIRTRTRRLIQYCIPSSLCL